MHRSSCLQSPERTSFLLSLGSAHQRFTHKDPAPAPEISGAASSTRPGPVEVGDELPGCHMAVGVLEDGGGAAFMELQFHPPGEAPFADSISCDHAHWCAALTIDSLECTLNLAICNPTAPSQATSGYPSRRRAHRPAEPPVVRSDHVHAEREHAADEPG